MKFKGENPCPGRLTDAPAKPGAYFACNGAYYASTGNFYLLNHPNLMWVRTNVSNMLSVPSVLKIIMASNFTLLYGRYVKNGNTYLGSGHERFSMLVLPALSNEIKAFANFDVMTCGKEFHYDLWILSVIFRRSSVFYNNSILR